MWRLIGSPGYPRPDEDARAVAYETYDRGICPSGTMRQMLAVLSQPNRSERLHDVRIPTLVIHGLADKMVHVSGGRATAAAIPGAELLLVDGMGHDLPPSWFRTSADAIPPHRLAGLSSADRPPLGHRSESETNHAGRAPTEPDYTHGIRVKTCDDP
jgi:hypothetical protein